MSEAAILSEEQESKEDFCTRCLQKRCILAVMGFGCLFVLSALRISISLSIVAMVDWKKVREKQGFNASTNESCQFVGEEERPDSEDGPFVWQPEVQGHILGCYFCGFAATQLLGKRLAELSSAKSVLLLGTFVASTCTLLVPSAASDAAYVLMVLEIFKGFGQGVIMPAFIVLMDNWISSTERIRFIAFTICGIPFGNFFTVILSGLICKAPFLGWKYVFYIFGTMGVVWCLIWFLVIHDLPHAHPHITMRELHRITCLMLQDVHQMPRPVPMNSIQTSKPVWAYIVAGFASIWCLNLYVSVIPLFMGTILKFNIVMNGIMSSIPNLVEAFVLVLTSLVSHHLQKKKMFRTTVMRKITISIGLCGCAICMIVVTFVRCDRILSVFFLVMALGMSGFNFTSTATIPVDMSPRFAGTMSAYMNTIGALSGVIIPEMMGHLTMNRQTMDEWSIIFYTSAVICLFALIVFLLFGSSEIQPWNNPPVIQSSESNDIAQVENLVNYMVQTKVDEDEESSSNDKSGPSSQAPLIAEEDKNKENQPEEKRMNGPRPWRTASFPQINFPQEPIVFISSSQVPLTTKEDKY